MYYLIEITTTGEDIQKGVYSYPTLTEAVANYHSKLGGQMKNPLCLGELVMVIDDNGAVYHSEKFNKEV